MVISATKIETRMAELGLTKRALARASAHSFAAGSVNPAQRVSWRLALAFPCLPS